VYESDDEQDACEDEAVNDNDDGCYCDYEHPM